MIVAEMRAKFRHRVRVSSRDVAAAWAACCAGSARTSGLAVAPVAEELQLGMTTGLALAGMVPVSIFPRWNFLLCAMNQLVNHLDKIQVMSNGGYKIKVIVRTGIGSQRPLHPQHQHVGDFTEALRSMCTTIDIIRLDEPSDIYPAYQKALWREDGRSTILVEHGDFYNEK